MSSRPLLIAGIVGGAVAGIVLLSGALVLVATDGAALSGSMMATLVLGAVGAWVLDGTWLIFAVDRLQTLGHGRDGEEGEGDDGWGRPGPSPVDPSSPSDDLDWWPEFERDLRAHLQERERERTPVAN